MTSDIPSVGPVTGNNLVLIVFRSSGRKKFTVAHAVIARCFNEVLKIQEGIFEFFTKGKTFLLLKDDQTSDPTKYRPITCMPIIYKLLSGQS